jgi:hypothetical protein
MIKIEHNVKTGEITEVDLTPEEIEKYESWVKESAKIAEIKAEEIAMKKAAKAALLEKLGITEEEARLLLS